MEARGLMNGAIIAYDGGAGEGSEALVKQGRAGALLQVKPVSYVHPA